MKLDLGPVRRDYVVPTFDGDDRTPMAPELQRRLRRPMIIGGAVIGAFVVGLGLWASVTELATGISAPAEIRVDSMKKTLRHKETGTVKQILVREGQLVHANQPVLLFSDVEARAAVDVLQGQYDTLSAQKARFTAEATGKRALELPPELTSRMGDPRVAGLISDQQFLFTSRLQLVDSQAAVLNQRLEQQQNQIQGQQARVASIIEQERLTNEELDGYKKLNEQGFAPKNLLLRYDRTLADLAGQRGQMMAEIARLRQQMGETRMQLASLRDERESQAAEGVRDSEAKLADVGPRLVAARQALESTVVRSPVDGYVFQLTQFTPGGVAGAGEVLMNIIPSQTPLTVSAMVKPSDIQDVHVGMPAKVKLTGLNQRFNDSLNAKVSVVGADLSHNEKTGEGFYRVDLQIPPTELRKIHKDVSLTSGMPALALIVTGKRSVMGFLISPITSTMEDAFREK
jgi:HlyD family type I secretion membrane fusion protein